MLRAIVMVSCFVDVIRMEYDLEYESKFCQSFLGHHAYGLLRNCLKESS